MLSFLEEILTPKEISELREILDFSLDTKIDLKNIQEKIAFANYFNAKLTKIIYKLRLFHTGMEIEYDTWYATEIHNIAVDYDGFPELLKTPKDYDRELKKHPDYIQFKTTLNKVNVSIKSLESKEKELSAFDWKIKGIIDIHKIQNNIIY